MTEPSASRDSRQPDSAPYNHLPSTNSHNMSVSSGNSLGTHDPISSSYHRTIKSPILRGDELNLDSQITTSPNQIVEIIHNTETKRFRLGIMLIVIAVATWMIGLELVNAVLKDDSYQKPFFFAYITGSCFSLNLIPDVFQLLGNNWDMGERMSGHKSFDNVPIPLSRKQVLVLAIQVAVIYYLYNSMALMGLKYTSASNQTVLSSTTSIFTLFIGSYLKIDSFSIKKSVCTIVSFIGVLLVNFSESKSSSNSNHDGNKFVPKNPALGNSMAIVQALLYAFYLIIMKIKCGTGDTTTNERRLFGLVGLITMITGVPLLYILHITNVEPFEFPPPNTAILLLILINGVFSYISDFTTVLALLLTSPLITSLSLTSSIPITIFIDYVILSLTKSSKNPSSPPSNSNGSTLIYIMGIVSILASVVLININSTAENELIELVIDQTLDEAIRDDEALSPVLSPILTSRPHSNFGSPLLSIRNVPSRNKVSKLSLEGSLLINRNHSSRLYTVGNDREGGDGFGIGSGSGIGSGTGPGPGPGPGSSSNLMVYGGNNHIYHVRHVDEENGEEDGGDQEYTV